MSPAVQSQPLERPASRRSRVPDDGESALARVALIGTGVPVVLYFVLGLLVHGVIGVGGFQLSELAPIGAWFKETRAIVGDRMSQQIDIEPVKDEPPPPPPPPEPEKEKEPEPVKLKDTPKDELPSPPALSQASQVLTQKADPNAPEDMTGFVQGNADNYAGLPTVANGKNAHPVANAAPVTSGASGGTGTVPTATGRDDSRAAGLLGSTDWSDCPFPPEADAEQIDQALVTVQVNVSPEGRATSVSILSDPGHGFGRAAKSCANQKRYQTAQDREGHAIGGQTKPFRVRFRR